MTRAVGGVATRDWHRAGAEESDNGVKFMNPAVLAETLILRVAESRPILNFDNRKILTHTYFFLNTIPEDDQFFIT